jgi:hypothetical protein
LLIPSVDTDPALFQAVYDKFLSASSADAEAQILLQTQLDVDLEMQSSVSSRPPVFDDHLYDPRMSSSPVLERSQSHGQNSARKLKRSKTMGHSSLTEVSEPGTEYRKVKRARTLREGEGEGTQVMTSGGEQRAPIAPKKTKDSEGVSPRVSHMAKPTKDEWDFPGSSAELAPMVYKSRNADVKAGMKTYGKSGKLRRSKTSVVSSSPPYEEIAKRAKDDGDDVMAKKRSTRSRGDEDLVPMLPKPKRLKSAVSSVNAGILERAAQRSDNMDSSKIHELKRGDDFNIDGTNYVHSGDTEVISPNPPSIQVPRTINQEIEARTTYITISSATNTYISSTEGINVVNDSHANTSSTEISRIKDSVDTSAVFLLPPPLPISTTSSSLIITPITLTSSQKQQYKVVNTASSTRSNISSIPSEIMDPVNPHLKFTGESSTIPNDTPRGQPPSGELRAPSWEPFSSPPIATISRMNRRAKSTVGHVEVS